MSLPNPNTVVTESRLKEFYDGIFPYLGGSADAGFTPVGSVIAIMGVTAPANYLACDGTVYNIADYPELANYFYQQFGSKNKFGGDGTTTFGIPDLRGEFLRGTGTNSHANQGSGANVGVHQDATELPFVYTYKNADGTMGQISGRSSSDVLNEYNLPAKVDAAIKGSSASNFIYHQDTLRTSSSDETYKISTRPTNTSVLFCIATKNIYLNPSLDYSTDEKVVGTWLNGETLYQKTVDCGALPNNDSIDVNHNISNASKIYDIKAVAVAISGSSTYTIPNSTTNNEPIDVNVNTTRIRISCRGEWSEFKGFVTIQYTKTT